VNLATPAILIFSPTISDSASTMSLIHGGFAMLVLTRKTGEKIHIGDGITLTVVEVSRSRVRLGIDAPTEVRVRRGELNEFAEVRKKSAKREAVA
jgi:carbon storage regulator